MAEPKKSLWTEVPKAVRDLRKSIGETQEQFAARMKTVLRTVARWESNRPPRGEYLDQLADIAEKAGRVDLAGIFLRAKVAELVVDPFIEAGVAQYNPGPDGSRFGVLIQWFEGDEEWEYVRCFLDAFAALHGEDGTAEAYRQALRQFAASVWSQTNTMPLVLVIANQATGDKAMECLRGMPVRSIVEQADVGDWGEFVDRERPDIVLLDITNTPAASVDHTIRAIRRTNSAPAVIGLQGTDDPEATLNAIRAGAADVILAPFDAVLTKLVERVAAQRPRDDVPQASEVAERRNRGRE